MSTTTLYFYDLASKDVKINSTPSRNPDGSYKWSNGQEDILNQSQFEDLRKHHSEIVKLEARIDTLSREMLMYQSPVHSLEQDGEALAKVWQSEIDEEQLNLKGLKAELKQFDEDMFNRGHFIEEEKEKPAVSKAKEKKPNWFQIINWKAVFRFLAIWGIGEVFMTYVQWSALRDEKGIEDLVVRSLAFAVTLFLLHYVAHLNKKRAMIVYYVYMGFNLLMLLTMLFAPLTISKLYPVETAASVQDTWSLTDNVNAGNITTLEYPFWVEFYRSYEVTPAILCFLFFVAMLSFMKPKPKEPVVQEKEPEMKSKTVQDEIREKRNHFKAQIKDCENRIEDLRNKLTSALTSNTTHISNVLTKLETAKAEILAAENKIKELWTKIEALLKAVEKELNLYKTEYLDILRNDHIKSSFVTPEWNNRNDIIHYFKIQTK